MVQLLKPLVGKKLRMSEIQRKIMINIGTSETVVRESLKFMIDLGLIKEVDHLVFQVMSCELEDE
jgi:hypothetical protein|tara:strand:- start:544 stop:738 length:195 start_codon:yes stop_codon:yes gene_type:complete